MLPEAVTRKLSLDEAKGPANLANRRAKSVDSLASAFCCCLSSSAFFLSSCFLSTTLVSGYHDKAGRRNEEVEEEGCGFESGAKKHRRVARAAASFTNSSQVVW